ncbi:penicillin-binding transpeptidase domain-containing protein, partial [Vibrio sp. 10N.261.45.F1]
MYEPIHIIKSNDQDFSKQIIKRENAEMVLQMLEGVTQKGGTATRAAVPGYRVAAKTGTSRKAAAGGYSDEY